MTPQDWFVDDTGQCQARPTARPWDLLRENFYMHQFLTEILEIVGQAQLEQEEWNFLPQIRTKVRQLVMNSYWLRTQYAEPDFQTGVNVSTLYDEIGYPLTVQNVTTHSGVVSTIHNHGTWGIVFQLRGRDRHTFWRRTNSHEEPLNIEPTSEIVLGPGHLLSLHPDAIHQVETVGPDWSLNFQLYGDTQPKRRFQFEPETQTARPF
ncbi:MAG: cupin [Cyanobacteria bacterium P01_E01_bin.34]